MSTHKMLNTPNNGKGGGEREKNGSFKTVLVHARRNHFFLASIRKGKL